MFIFNLINFSLFSCLIGVAKMSNTLMNKNYENRQLCFVHSHRRKVFKGLLPLSLMVIISFFPYQIEELFFDFYVA